MVFYGESSESQETELKGKLILNNPESISVKSVRITLTGTRKVSYVSNILRMACEWPVKDSTDTLCIDGI